MKTSYSTLVSKKGNITISRVIKRLNTYGKVIYDKSTALIDPSANKVITPFTDLASGKYIKSPLTYKDYFNIYLNNQGATSIEVPQVKVEAPKQKVDKMQQKGVNATTTSFEEVVKGHTVKIYQLGSEVTPAERSRVNANILFDEVYQLAHKKYSVAVVNEQKTGGVLYTFGADKNNRYTYAEQCKQALDKNLKAFGLKFGGTPPSAHTGSSHGALIKIPFSITRDKEAIKTNLK